MSELFGTFKGIPAKVDRNLIRLQALVKRPSKSCTTEDL